jgi:glutamate-1-semialdehyde 2,1-aminomutase
MLRYIKAHPEIYPYLEKITARLCEAPPPGVTVNRVGSMFTMFFTETPVTDYETAKTSDTGRFARFFHHLLGEGIYFAPSQFEAGFVSVAHTEADIEKSRQAIHRFFA